jgi:peptide deformylase
MLGDSILRQKCADILGLPSTTSSQLVSQLQDFLQAAGNGDTQGIGLAAPQVLHFSRASSLV